MNICELCIRRPVFASVLSIFILLIGLVSYNKLSTKEYPDIELPVVTINCVYKGASPDLIESSITNIIEDGLAGIEGIESITSNSEQGQATISITFTLETDIDASINDVRAKIAAASNNLPSDMDPPVITSGSEMSRAIIYLALYSDQLSIVEITDFAKRLITKKLEVLSGVSKVEIFCGNDYEIKINPNQDLLALHNITIADIQKAVAEQNQNYPTGRLSGGNINLSLVMDLDMHDVEEFANIVLKKTDNNLVRLSDVAKVTLGASGDQTLGRYNSKNAIIIAVSKQPKANPIDISKLVSDELVNIKKILPESLTIKIAFDTAKFIKASIKAIYTTIFEAIFLVVIVILIFLQSFRSSIIPVITIPISLIGTFALMLMFGFSINNFTLLAMILAIGLVVDDAIVMMENIYRYIEQGMDAKEAAIKGSKEIMFAVMAMTMTLVAVFLPVGFMRDFIGKFFNEFAWTLAFSVVISGFVSLTLSPMMSSLILTKHHDENKFFAACARLINAMHTRYHALLIKAIGLKRRYLAYTLLALLTVGGAVFMFIKQELLPLEDRGYLFMMAQSPEGASFNYTKKYLNDLEKIISVNPNIENYFSFIMPDNSFAFADLKDWSSRSVSQMDIANQINARITKIPGIMSFAINPPSIDTGHDDPVQLVLRGYVSFAELDQIAEKIMAKMRMNPKLMNINKNIKLNSPALKIKANRDKIAYFNVDIKDVAKAISTSFVSNTLENGFKLNGELYDVQIELVDHDKADASALEKIYVTSRDGKAIPLLALINYDNSIQPKMLRHYNKLRSVTVTASANYGVDLASIVPILEQIAREETANKSVYYEFAGEIRDMEKSSYDLYIIFMLAILFIYLILAAQFESFLDSGIILCSVPFAIVGALLTLFLIGGSLNIYSKIGLITLIGLIAKNAILIVEFTNQKLAAGIELEKAVIDAASTRLRPIMMTTLSMIVGAIPLAFATGPGAISRNEIGWVIVGGLFIGTSFTLFVIPIICIAVKRLKRA